MVSVKAALVNLSLFAGVLAQDLSIPTSWHQTTSALSRDQRYSIAQGAADELEFQINATTGVVSGLSNAHQVASQFAVLAQQDWLSGNTSFNHTVLTQSQVWTGLNGLASYANDGSDQPQTWGQPIYWSIVYFYAHRAYGGPFLSLAISAWQEVYDNAFISEVDVANGAVAGTAGRLKSYAPPAGCKNGTIAGGVFYYMNSTDTTINSETVGPFMAVSAYLYEATQNSTYLTAAQLSLDFMVHHLWDGTIVYDIFIAESCSFPIPDALLSYNQAWFIEGLSVMANITRNDTLITLLHKAIPSVITYPQWTSQNGIISEGSAQHNLKAIFVRGLAEARRRNPGRDLAAYIEAYITLQYNAVLDNARGGPDSNYYGEDWFGKLNDSAAFDGVGSITALDVLNAAFSFVDSEKPPSSGDNVRTTTSHTGVIAGSVGGAVFVLLIIAACSWRYRRRRRRTVANAIRETFDGSDSGSEDGGMIVEPLDVQPYGSDNLGMDLRANGSMSSILSPGSLDTGGGRSTLVTVGHRSKLERFTDRGSPLASEETEDALPTSPAVHPEQEVISRSAPASPTSAYEDIPGLVQVLFNNLVQDHALALRPGGATGQYHNSEAPPQYEDEAGEQRRA